MAGRDHSRCRFGVRRVDLLHRSDPGRTLGLTSLGALARYESLRPLFSGLTIIFFAVAFFFAYRKRDDAACETGSACEVHGVDRVRRVNRIVLWIATIVSVVVLTFPTWSNWILG